MVQLDTDQLNGRFDNAAPQEIIQWAWDTFGTHVAATSSFQTQSMPLLHMISEYAPQIPILFLDTGFHFSETLHFRDQVTEEFGLNVQVLKTRKGHANFRRRYGELHRSDPDLCCHLNKVQPLRRAMEGYDAWIAGIRRDQTQHRANTPVVASSPGTSSYNVYKICPLATWAERDVWQYIHDHKLPEHPLLREGYLSIGCAPCTQPANLGEGERSGRWNGRQKTECGLHLDELDGTA